MSPQLIFGSATYLLASASERNRLDATTFRIINIATFLSAILTLSPRSAGGRFPSSFLFKVTTLVLRSLHSIPTLMAGARIFSEYPLPTLKFDENKSLSTAYVANAVFSLRSGLMSLFMGSLDMVSARLLLIPAMYLALSGAAIAGPKRLSSDTYISLNRSVILFSLISLLLGKCCKLTTIFELGTSVSGLVIGMAYKPPREEEAPEVIENEEDSAQSESDKDSNITEPTGPTEPSEEAVAS